MALGIPHGELFRSNNNGSSRDWWNQYGSAIATFGQGISPNDYDGLHLHRWLVFFGSYAWNR